MVQLLMCEKPGEELARDSAEVEGLWLSVEGCEDVESCWLSVECEDTRRLISLPQPNTLNLCSPSLNSQLLALEGLTAGVTCITQLCAIGGSTGQSDWSEPVSKMAM
jgi:hypothetical protein